MRFSLQPEQRPEQQLKTLPLEGILQAVERESPGRPPLEHYFSPTKKESFIKDFLHYLNSILLESRGGEMSMDRYLVLVLTFQFTAPLLEIPLEKEFGLFCRILHKTYGIPGEELDLNMHFGTEDHVKGMIGEKEALKSYRQSLSETYTGSREVKESVQKRVKKDALEALSAWQQENTLPALAEAFGRSIVIPAFFRCTHRRLVQLFRDMTGGITYLVTVPPQIEKKSP